MDKIQRFWNDFCMKSDQEGIEYNDAFQFGADADWLADLVINDKKTATTSGFVFYELEKVDLPQVGEFNIVLNGENDPVAVIQVKSVDVVPMNEVREDFALAEGEGDYKFWWEAHEKFFTELLKEYDKEFSPDMLVVCERFEKIYSK